MKFNSTILLIPIILLNIACSQSNSTAKMSDESEISITDAWVRLLPEKVPNTAAYMTIRNNSDKSLKIVKAESKVAKMTQIHTVIKENDVMKMTEVEFIEIPARGSIELKPKSFHVMLMNLRKPLTNGQPVTIELITETGETITVNATVRDN